ncbi:MAG: hypothetical protein IKW57_01760 [Alphaproteobacteria bacterium]|nr:hypothetical protein [Alphaproteobacteria bacterium]
MEHVIKGSTELNKMFMALQRTAAGLRRDFGEVENLQQSLRSARDFVTKAANRIEESIVSDLMLVRPAAGLLTPNIARAGDGRDEFVLSLSGASNFVRGNPHFAISLALRSNDETRIALIYSPIDDRLYYAEAEHGAFMFSAHHSARLRVSNLSDVSEITVGYNVSDDRPMIGDVRCTGCPALDMAWVAAGKLDAYVSDLLDYAEIAAGDLIVRESGGQIEMLSDLIVTNGRVQI